LEVLKAQFSFSDESVTAMVALLRDEHEDVRAAAAGILKAQSRVSDKRFTAVVALPRDKD